MVKLFADSTCDLSDEILDKYNISIAPLSITFNGKTYKDRVDLQPGEYYEMMKSFTEHPSTAMPSPVAFRKIIDDSIAEGYDEFLCICMSSGTSGSYQSAVIAKDDFYDDNPDSDIKIHVVDSKSMSHGSGYLIMKSAMMLEQGATYQEVIDFNETYKMNIKHFLAVNDLENLIVSGRLSNVSAMIGKVLKINPIMSMRNGKGAIVAKVRSEKKVYSHYVKGFQIRVDKKLTDFIIIGYTSDIGKAETLKEKLLAETNFEGEIYIMQMGVSVGTHVGLGGLSMFFIETGDRHDGLVYNEINDLIERKNEMQKRLEELIEKRRESLRK